MYAASVIVSDARLSAEPVYRLAEKEWKDFIDEFTPLLVEADPEIPHLPAKDVIHRIYRDVRVSAAPPPFCRLVRTFVLRGRGGT